ncbi:hypothetical protein GF327_06915 [Candidatus Woesearchaeota archaeon]|nr:hypothetical protein [Candidatus Woesearchaeota archaeon]
MINKSNVLEIIKKKGPVIPRDIMKELGGDTFLIGAVLSQLKSSNLIKVSNTKIGGSPVYYLPEQKPKLQDLYDHLHHAEKKAYDLLKEKGILKDSKLEPSIRVALRNIKDFAKPVEVNLKDRKILFWRWFLLSNQEVETKIRNNLSIKTPEQKQEKQTSLNKKKQAEKKQKPEKQDKNNTESKQTKKGKKIEDDDDEFFCDIQKYFNKHDIDIVNKDIIRKNREIDMIVKVPSAVGKLNYYCKARNIKKTNHGHLSTAYVEGQNRKLPILYLTTGILTSRAEDMLEQEFKNITVKKI